MGKYDIVIGLLEREIELVKADIKELKKCGLRGNSKINFTEECIKEYIKNLKEAIKLLEENNE